MVESVSHWSRGSPWGTGTGSPCTSEAQGGRRQGRPCHVRRRASRACEARHSCASVFDSIGRRGRRGAGAAMAWQARAGQAQGQSVQGAQRKGGIRIAVFRFRICVFTGRPWGRGTGAAMGQGRRGAGQARGRAGTGAGTGTGTLPHMGRLTMGRGEGDCEHRRGDGHGAG